MTIQHQRKNTKIAELVGAVGLVIRVNSLEVCPFGFSCGSYLYEYLQPLILLSRRLPELRSFRSSNPVTSDKWIDVGVFTLLQDTERNVRSTRRFMVPLVI